MKKILLSMLVLNVIPLGVLAKKLDVDSDQEQQESNENDSPRVSERDQYIIDRMNEIRGQVFSMTIGPDRLFFERSRTSPNIFEITSVSTDSLEEDVKR